MKKLYQKLLTLSLMGLLFMTTGNVMGQTTLSAGDIAMIGVNSDNDDEFAFVTLVPLDAGTEIRFTDSGWLSSGTFRNSEGAIKYTAPSAISAGTVIVCNVTTITAPFAADNDADVGNNGMNLSASGDQVLAFQGASLTPTFIAAINFEGSGVWQADATNSNDSALPTGLTEGTNAVAIVEADNMVYNGLTSGTPADLLALINSNTNWTTDNTTRQTLSISNFTVTAPCTAPSTQATFAAASAITDNGLTLNPTRGNGTDLIILAKKGAAVDATPESGTAYTANAFFGSGNELGTGNFVVYNGTDAGTFTHAITNLQVGTEYHFAAFEYNTADDCYLTPGETVSATTTGNALPELDDAATATAATTSEIVLTFSESVTATNADGLKVNINGTDATIASTSDLSTPSTTITLTLSETITSNSGTIAVAYDATLGSIVDAGGAELATIPELTYVVTNNTTLNIVANLTEARALASGENVQVTGGVIVTYLTGNTRNQFFVQDANAGILVDDNGAAVTTAYNIGDEIVDFTGSLASFGGITQFVPAADPGAANSTGNAITPIVVSIADYNAAQGTYESRVVQFNEVTFDEANATATFDAQTSVTSTLNDGVNTLDFDADNGDFDFTNIDYATSVIPTGRLDVVAIGRGSKVSSRSAADIQDNYAPLFSQAPAAGTPTVSAFDVTFRLDEPGTVYYVVDQSATAPDVATVLASATSQAYTDPTADGTISLTGLDDNVQYYVHMVAADDEGTPNEQASVTTVNATTVEIVFDATSDIVAAASPITAATLSSVANAAVEAVDVFNFRVTDDNATDTEPTAINTIVIENNNPATWSTVLEGASITDGTTANVATSITDSEITFDVSGSQYFVTGGTEITFTLSVWLKTTQTDGTELQFTIPTDHAFVADASGSVIKPTLAAAITSAAHTVDVVATTFDTTVPTRVQPATDFSVGVIAQDANGNTDTAARSIDLSVSSGSKGGSGTLSSATGLTAQAMVDGAFTYTDVQYSQVEDIVLGVTDGVISATTSFFKVSDLLVEDFTNSNATSSYSTGTFTGNNGIDWTYVASRDGNGDANGSGIDLPALMLRRVSDESKITSSTISGGIENFSVKLYKGFTGANDRQVALFINGDSITSSTAFDNFDEQLFEVNNINIEGDVIIELRNTTAGQIIIDDISWTGYIDPCIEPTTQATALSATAVDNNTVDLAWTVGNGDATIILAKEGAAVDAEPEILTAYTAAAAFGVGTEIGTANFVVYSGADATAQVTTLTQGTEYHFAAYAFNTTDNCYYLVEPALASVTTPSNNDADSDILAAASPIAAGVVPATANAAADAVNVFSFTISDAGTADGVATIVNSVKIVPAANNTAAWSTAIAGATLADGTFTASNATITDGAIIFDLTANQFTVNDGADATLTLSVYLNTTQTDGEVLAFAIPTAHEFIAAGAGSLFADAVTGATSNDHTINVLATTYALTSSAAVNTGTAFSIGVTAQDANENIDTAARTVTLSGGTGTITGTTELALTNGVGTFSGLSYDTEEAVTFTVSDGSVEATTVITFTTASGDGTLFFSEYIEGSSNNKAIEIYNGTDAVADLSEYRIIRYNNGATEASDTLELAEVVATLAAGELIVIANPGADQAILDVADFTDGITFYNGNDALMLYRGEELIDAFGLVGEDPAGGAWAVAGVDIATKEYTLVRKPAVISGNATALASFGTDAASSEWIVNPQNDFTNIGIFGEVTDPTIIASTLDFNGTFGFVANGSSSVASSYTVSALNLTTDLVITAPAGFELSLGADFATPAATLTLAQTEGVVAETPVFVRFTPTAANGEVYAGDITHTSTDAATVTIAVSGTEGSLTLNNLADVRANNALGDLVKVTGIIIGGTNHSSASRVLQDNTAGITVRGFDFPTADLVVGDSIVIEGELSEFNGLLQLEPTAAITVVSQGNALPAAQVKTIPEISENDESELVLVENVRFVIEDGIVEFAGGGAAGNFRVANDAGDTLAFRLGSDQHPLVGTTIPTDYVNITAWVGQFNDAYQLSPETAEDIEIVVPEPTIVVSGADAGFDFGSVEVNSLSDVQSFTVSGTSLSGDILLTAPAGYSVSLNDTEGFDTSISAIADQEGTVAETTVYVRFAPTVTGTINGDLSITSGELAETVALTGTATEAIPTANAKVLSGVKAYPNPTNGLLQVELPNTNTFSYQLIRMDGSVVLKGTARQSTAINIADVTTGLYLIEVVQGDKVFRTRIVKN